MDIEFLGATLDVAGKVLIAYTAIAVHYRFRREHKIDEQVFRIMKREQALGVLGILLILAGYILRDLWKVL